MWLGHAFHNERRMKVQDYQPTSVSEALLQSGRVVPLTSFIIATNGEAERMTIVLAIDRHLQISDPGKVLLLPKRNSLPMAHCLFYLLLLVPCSRTPQILQSCRHQILSGVIRDGLCLPCNSPSILFWNGFPKLFPGKQCQFH